MILSAALALFLTAAAPDAATPTISVSGIGSVETPPDMAKLSIDIRGDGKTPDEASAELERKQKAIFAGISSLTPGGVAIRTGDVSIRGLRSSACDDNEASTPNTGACAIIGYAATSSTTINMTSVDNAGTAVGLAGRLGASGAQISGFELKSDAAARGKATALAFANARDQANAIAAASGRRLGPIIEVTDGQSQNGGITTVTDSLQGLASNFRPAPIRIGVSPEPVRTTARLSVTFRLLD